ncbi:monovalent cation/H(+) antiporter subunit G [Bacillus alkalicellulosilyticus]|uniref:monovalent cation/H(+) antiporter subunit G n=1 Tax=Alkalihalobacterium alkalicellulosilyticum TaxID=1912214 RepID=UPI0009989A2D|nr:monovalent cation/H(+) antiporter subunit G [Bacillus alkalicellulosilyticus]
MSLIEIIISILVLLGGLLSLLGAIGIIRFPDVYGRLHAATKSATLGVILIMLATFLYFLIIEQQFVVKVLLTIVFVFLTAPVAGLMMSRSAYRIGVPLWEKSVQDDLKHKVSIEKNRKLNVTDKQ